MIAIKPQSKPHANGNDINENGANGNDINGNGANQAHPLTLPPLNPWSPEAHALAVAAAKAIASNLNQNDNGLHAIGDATAGLYLFLDANMVDPDCGFEVLFLDASMVDPDCCFEVMMTQDRKIAIKLMRIEVTDYRGINQAINNGSHTFIYCGQSPAQAALEIETALPNILNRWAETKATERAILADTLTVARTKADLLAAHANAQQALYDTTYLQAHLPYTWSTYVSPDGLTVMMNYDLCDDRQHIAQVTELLRLHESHRCARRHPPRSNPCPPTAPS